VLQIKLLLQSYKARAERSLGTLFNLKMRQYYFSWVLLLTVASSIGCGGGGAANNAGAGAASALPAANSGVTATTTTSSVSTPSTDVTPVQTVNPVEGPSVKISGLKRLYASTSQEQSTDPAGAADDSLLTRWSSGHTGKAWLMMDLGAPARIDRLEINWETAWSSKYTIEVSNDRSKWLAVGAAQTNRSIKDKLDAPLSAVQLKNVVTLNLTQNYRYIRINSTERGWSDANGRQYGISIIEWNVFGAGGRDNPPPIAGPAAPTGSAYSLVWSDEFDSASAKSPLDATKWTHEIGNGCDKGNCGWGNNELQYYTNSLDNVYTQNGYLNIQLRKDIPINGKPAYTSGRINTLGKFEFTYGRIVGRIRMLTPTSSANGAKDGPLGVWSGFWMLGSDVNDPYIGWPNSGEQDIMENIGYSWWFSSSLHGPGYNGGGSLGQSYNKVDTSNGIAANTATTTPFSSTDWHEYEAEWGPNQVTFKLDGKVTKTLSRAEVETRGYWVYDKANFILLNLAYGGGYPDAYRNDPKKFTGAAAANGLAQLAESNFPHTMQVDWVRVYQQK
jgi:beta-glucanase (GH16 family)